jgi:6-pyruvoyl-tetrahydropterin synthase related domain
MRRWIPALILASLAAIASRPLWSSQFLFSYDGPLHLFRVFALDLTLHQGVVYPRWLIDLAYGYGYPIFDYYPPFAAYAAETVHLLGLGFAEALKATFIAIIALSLTGAYALGTELFAGERYSRAIGILTSVAYVFFPYFMVGIYSRGALAEAFAVALLPWMVWSLHRALVRRTPGSILPVALMSGILFVTHSLTAVIAAPFFAAYTALELLRLPSEMRIKALSLAAASAVLGLCVAAFYWLPFLAELPLVKMGAGMDILSDIFESNFLSLSALVQPSFFYEYGGPPVPLGLTATSIGALVLGGAVCAGKRLRTRGTILFFGAVGLIGALAVTEPARDLWLALPLSSMIQSVWRVELLVNLGIAVVIGSMPLVLSKFVPLDKASLPLSNSHSQLVPLGAAALTSIILVWAAMGKLAPAQIVLPRNSFDLAHLARFEVSGASPGTTTFGEYMPVTATAANLLTYRAPNSTKLSSPLPETSLVRHRGEDWTFTVSASAPISILLHVFYFPDWNATIDGNPARVYSSTPLGLLTVDVPAGHHEVSLYAGSTGARLIGILLSATAILIVLALTAYGIWRRESEAWMALLVVCMLSVVFLLPAATALTASPLPLDSRRVGVSDGFDLIGLSVEEAGLEAGKWQVTRPVERLHLQVYWQVKTAGLTGGPITWRLTDDSGRVWAQRAQFPRYGTAPQQSWASNELVQDAYDLPLTSGIPKGVYNLQVYADSQRNFVTAAQIEFEAASPAVLDAQPQPQHAVSALLGNQIRLLGCDSPASASPGEPYDITLFWQAERDVFEDYTASVQLLGPDGKLAAQHDSITGEGLEPTSLWIPGEPVVERRRIDLPRGLKPGMYTLIALMYNLKDLKRLPVVTDAGPSPDNAVVLGQVVLSNGPGLDLTRILASLAYTR